MSNPKEPSDKESPPHDGDDEAFFRWFQKKYVFTDPDISRMAGQIADDEKKGKEFDEYFKRTYETKTSIRKPGFRLGAPEGEDSKTN